MKLLTPNDIFQAINLEINVATKYWRPSGCNKNMSAWVGSVKAVFEKYNIDEDKYWQDVLVRRSWGGRTPTLEQPVNELQNAINEASKIKI